VKRPNSCNYIFPLETLSIKGMSLVDKGLCMIQDSDLLTRESPTVAQTVRPSTTSRDAGPKCSTIIYNRTSKGNGATTRG